MKKIHWHLFGSEIDDMAWHCRCGFTVYQLAGAPERCGRCGKRLHLVHTGQPNPWLRKKMGFREIES